jgi:[acyl-carrier-protein] S-malonyltransferase
MQDPAPIAFVFPGQGSQALGMGRGLCETEPVAADTFAEADRLLGRPLSGLCWNGPAEALNDTVNTQPALFVHSLAVLRAIAIRRPDLKPAVAAGHSVGEISALAAAGALSFADGLRLVSERGEAMKRAGLERPGGMAAILGMAIEDVDQACREVSSETGRVLQVANDNCPGQVVISGDEEALRAGLERLKQRGAKKAIRLAVSIAAHSPLMLPAQQRFNRAIETTPFSAPQVPILANVTASPLRTADEIRAELSAQLTSRVRWTETIQALARDGIRTVIEIGTGSVLSGLIRRIEPAIHAVAIDSPASFDQLPN